LNRHSFSLSFSRDKVLGRGKGSQNVRALVIGPYLSARQASKEEARALDQTGLSSRSHEGRLAEALGLAHAIGLDVASQQIVPVSQIRPATFLGKGKVSEIAALVSAGNIDLVVMDCSLSPVQQRNLETALRSKVIDRTGLILEIFGKRARTREGVLQVELAHLAYQKSRLVRSWTHLERQRGGFGFLGGPGETQIEADRRLIEERMTRIERELESVKRTRGLHRKSRRAVPYPVVALVGYTNAGKSTLFNHLTGAGVPAEDKLFATLDPALRKVALPKGRHIILSDTVGFISDLPTMLIKAFRATLEEVLEADLILHVRDISGLDSEAQRVDVEAVLAALGIDAANDPRLVEIWNKCDLVRGGWPDALMSGCGSALGKPVFVSALTGQGMENLLAAIESKLATGRVILDIALDPGEGAKLSWLYGNTEVLNRAAAGDGRLHMTVRVAPERVKPVLRMFPAAFERRM
jgi:GTP-binding protein HflX